MEEQDPGTQVRMTHQPTTPVERLIFDNLNLLVLTIQQLVSPDTLRQLKDWASQWFRISVDENSRVWDVFYMLDEAGFINASNLMVPREFFANIFRFEIVHLLDEFVLGNYDILHNNRPVAPNNRHVAPNNRFVAPNHRPVAPVQPSLPGKRIILSSSLALSMFKITSVYYYYYITLILRMCIV